MRTHRPIFLILTILCATSWAQEEIIYQNNFDHHAAGLYTEAQLAADWNDPPWDDGVREGRVEIVEGDAAFGGTGSAMAVHYPDDEFGTKQTGAQWKFFLDESYEELTLTYRVRFENGFDFVRGGKLPGLAGGSAPSGSAPADGVRGWTGRLMWRTDFTGTSGVPEQLQADGISYAKHLDSGFDQDGRQEDQAYWLEPNGERTVIESGVWYQIRQRVRMNTPGVADGILQIWLDDQLVLDQNNLRFRSIAELKIDQMFFSTFFGGGSSWRTSGNEVAYFDDFTISVPVEAPPAEPRFLKVPSDYATIADAMDDANDGDTIAVRGTHTANVVVTKSISFRGYQDTQLFAADDSLPAITIASDSVLVNRFEIEGGSHAVLVQANRRDVLVQSVVSKNTGAGLLVESGCEDINIRNCDFTFSSGDGVSIEGCRNVELWRIESWRNDGVGFDLINNEDLLVRRSRAISNQSTGFVIIGDGVEFLENQAVVNQGSGFLIGSDGHSIVDNEARRNTGIGFEFVDSHDNFISENLSRFNTLDGFAWSTCDDNIVFDNVAQRNDGNGFYFSSCARAAVESNFVDESGLSGFFLDSGTTASTLAGNRANENDGFGFVDNGTDNQFISNNCRDNAEGDSSPAGICD